MDDGHRPPGLPADPHLPGGAVAEIERKGQAEARLTEQIRSQVVPLFASAAFPAAGNLLIVAQPRGPGVGRAWHVRVLRAVGGTPVANVGDTARFFFYVGPSPTDVASADVATSYRDDTDGTALPVAAFYGRHEFTFRYPNSLYAIVTGGTSGRVYAFTGHAEDVTIEAPSGAREVIGL